MSPLYAHLSVYDVTTALLSAFASCFHLLQQQGREFEFRISTDLSQYFGSRNITYTNQKGEFSDPAGRWSLSGWLGRCILGRLLAENGLTEWNGWVAAWTVVLLDTRFLSPSLLIGYLKPFASLLACLSLVRQLERNTPLCQKISFSFRYGTLLI